jgi:hypothetical protein
MSRGFEQWTEAQVSAHNARVQGKAQVGTVGVPVERESELHEQLRQACAARGWLPLHGSMAHKTHRTPGEWDFVILADCPRLFLVECKDREGKLSSEQAGLAAWAKKLGWQSTVCRSIGDFWAYVANYDSKHVASPTHLDLTAIEGCKLTMPQTAPSNAPVAPGGVEMLQAGQSSQNGQNAS